MEGEPGGGIEGNLERGGTKSLEGLYGRIGILRVGIFVPLVTKVFDSDLELTSTLKRDLMASFALLCCPLPSSYYSNLAVEILSSLQAIL